MYAENDVCFTMQMRKRQVYMEGMEAKQNIDEIALWFFLSAKTDKNIVLPFRFLPDRGDYSDLVFCTPG